METSKNKFFDSAQKLKISDTVKGFNDFTGEEALKREKIKEIIVETFKNYGFEPAETPVLEYEEFVKGENARDEAVSDTFKLQDKGKRNLALRYEFTFQLKRIARNRKLPYKRYQIGEVFRDEPISSNRFRQFIQCDADTVGATINDEAEILALASEILEKLGIKATININNRKLLEDITKTIFEFEDKESINECIRWLDELEKEKPSDIIKEIEKDEKKSSFKKKIQKTQYRNIFLPLLNTLRNLTLEGLTEYYLRILRSRGTENLYAGSLFKKGYEEIKELIESAKNYGIKLEFRGYLARGLSYYTGNVFEIVTEEIKETLIAGGTYLINGINSTGISFGLERLSALAKIKFEEKKVLVISIAQDKKAIELAEKLRTKRIPVIVMYKVTNALEYANSLTIPYVIFVGEKETKEKRFKLRDMKSGKEKLVLEDELIKALL